MEEVVSLTGRQMESQTDSPGSNGMDRYSVELMKERVSIKKRLFSKGATLLPALRSRSNHRKNKQNLKLAGLRCENLYQSAELLT